MRHVGGTTVVQYKTALLAAVQRAGRHRAPGSAVGNSIVTAAAEHARSATSIAGFRLCPWDMAWDPPTPVATVAHAAAVAHPC